jgi:hypothetical protein
MATIFFPGEIKKIDTSGLDYSIILMNGAQYKEEVEETSGVVHEFPNKILDWRINVSMESA